MQEIYTIKLSATAVKNKPGIIEMVVIWPAESDYGLQDPENQCRTCMHDGHADISKGGAGA